MKKRVLFLFMGLCLYLTSSAQVQVRGSVRDIQGEPIPGVTIVEKGTQHGVITDLDGNYNIAVSDANRFYNIHLLVWIHGGCYYNQSIINAVLQETLLILMRL